MFLRDVARWAGVRLATDSDQPRFWLNLLADRDGPTWYGLVHVGQWQGVPSAPATGRVTWPALPDGACEVSELTRSQDLGRQTGTALRSTGLAVTLAPREVAICRFRFDRPVSRPPSETR